LREERRLSVTENRVLRRISGPKKNEVTGERRKLPNEEFNELYSSPNVIRLIKSRRIGWTGHVVCMGDSRGAYGVSVGKNERKRPSEDQDVDRRIILRWILSKWDVGI
jgi:hypothetical protein